MVVGQLEIDLMTNIAAFTSDMNAMKGTVTNTMESINSSVETAKSALEALGIGFGMVEINDFVEGAIESADALDLMSQKIGISIESLTQFTLLANQSGVSQDQLAMGMKNLSVYMAKNSEGLASLGVTSKDTNTAFKQLADVFQTLPDGYQKTALAQEIFKRSGIEMIPMLNQGSAGFEKSAEESKNYSAVMTQFAPIAHEFNDRLEQLKISSGGLGNIIGLALMPYLTSFADKLISLTQGSNAQDWVNKLSTAFGLLVNAIEPALKIFVAYWTYTTLLPAAITAISFAFAGLETYMALITMQVIDGATAWDILNMNMTEGTGIMTTFGTVAGALKATFGLLFAAFAGWEIGTYLRDNFNIARVAGDAFVGALLVGWENVKYGAEMAWEAIKFAWDTTVNAMKTAFAAYLDDIAAGLKMVGATDTSAQVQAYADSLQKAGAQSQTFTQQTAALTAAHQKALAAINDNVTGLVAFDMAATKAGASTSDLTNKTGQHTAAEIAAAQAAAAALLNRVNNQKAMDELYKTAIATDKGNYALEEANRSIHDIAMNAEYQRALKDVGNFGNDKENLEEQQLLNTYKTNQQQLDAEMTMAQADLKAAQIYNQKPAVIAAANAKIDQLNQQMLVAAEKYYQGYLTADQTFTDAKKVEDQKAMDSMVTQTAALNDQATSMQQSNAMIGMSAEDIAALTAKRDDDTISVLHNEIAMLQAQTVTDNTITQIALLTQQIAALGAQRDATLAKPMLEEWDKDVQQFSNDFQSGEEGMINKGLSAWHTFTQSLGTTFKTEVIDVIYKTFEQPFVVNLVASVLGISVAGAAGSAAASAGGEAIGGSSLLSAAGNWIGSSGISVGTSQALATAGSTLYQMGGTDAGTWLMSNASSIGNIANTAGSTLGYLTSVSDVLQGNVMGAIGSAVGTFFGGPIGGFIGQTVGTWLNGALGIGGGETRQGGSYAANIGGAGATYVRGPSGGGIAQPQVEAATGAVPVTIDQMLALFNSGIKVTSFEGGLESSGEGKGGTYGGGTLSSGATFGNTNANRNFDQNLTSPQALTQYGNQLGTNILQGLQAANIQGPVGEFFNALGTLTVPLYNDTTGTQNLAATLAFVNGPLLQIQAAAQTQPAMWNAIMGSLKQMQASGETVTATATRMAQAFIDIQPAIAVVSQSTAAAWSPDTVQMVVSAGATIQQTSWQTWQTQTTAVEGLISTFDGSVAATNNLAAATQARYATEQALVNQLASDMGNLATSFSKANEGMATSLMTNDQKVNYYTDKMNQEALVMQNETDPTKLAGEAAQYLQDQQDAWSNMTTTEQQEAQTGWTQINNTISNYLQTQIGQSLDTISTTSGQTLPDQVTAAITSAFDPVSTAQQNAANDQQTAANTNLTAANTFRDAAGLPITINLTNGSYVGNSQLSVARS